MCGSVCVCVAPGFVSSCGQRVLLRFVTHLLKPVGQLPIYFYWFHLGLCVCARVNLHLGLDVVNRHVEGNVKLFVP